MEVTKRVDEELPDGTLYTKKVMENGEERTRIIFPGGMSISTTVADDWSPQLKVMPWQDPHFHGGYVAEGGLTEVYTQVEGWSAYIWQGENGVLARVILDKAGETINFKPRVPHRVLLGPKAAISTQVFGVPVGNPDRKNNDWWPAQDDFMRKVTAINKQIEMWVRTLVL